MNRVTFGKQGKWTAVAGTLLIVGLAGCASDPVDGSSQSIVVDTMPSYKIGDRVRYSSGVLSAY